MDMGKVQDWPSAVPSPQTQKTYKAGIKKFEEFYGQGIETLIGKSPEEAGHMIEKFYVWLKEKGHGQNTQKLGQQSDSIFQVSEKTMKFDIRLKRFF